MNQSNRNGNGYRIVGSLVAIAAALVTGTAIAENSTDTSFVKDLDVRQRPMVEQIVPVPSAKPSSATSKISVKATVDRPNRIYGKGDSVTVKVKATQDAYIWVFDTGTSGKVHQIFPNRYDSNNFLRAGKTLEVPPPGGKYMLSVNYPKGTELITVVASKDDVPLTSSLLESNDGGMPFRALRGTAASVSKDLSVTLKKKQTPWAVDQVKFKIR